MTVIEELLIEETRRRERERVCERRLHLEIPSHPPLKKEPVREPKRVIEIQL